MKLLIYQTNFSALLLIVIMCSSKSFAQGPYTENVNEFAYFPDTRPAFFCVFFQKEKPIEFKSAKLQELIAKYSQPVRRLKPGKILAYTGASLLISSIFIGKADSRIGRDVFLAGCTIAPVSLVLSIRDKNK